MVVGVREYLVLGFIATFVQAIAATNANGLPASSTATQSTKSTTSTTTTKTGTASVAAAQTNYVHYTECSNDVTPQNVFNCAGVCVKTSDHAAKQCRPIGYANHYQGKCGGAQQQCNAGLTSNDCTYPQKTSLESDPGSGAAPNAIARYCPKCGKGYMFSRNSDACVLPEFYQIDQDLIALYRLDAFGSVDVETAAVAGPSPPAAPAAWLYSECAPADQPGTTDAAKEEFSRICKINHCSALVQEYDTVLKFVANKTFSEAKPFNWGKMPRDMQFSEMSKLFWFNFNARMKEVYGATNGCDAMGSGISVGPSTATANTGSTWQDFVEERVSQQTAQTTFCSCAKYYVAPYVKQHFDNNVPYAAPKYNLKLFGAASKKTDIHQTKKDVHITFTAISGSCLGALTLFCCAEFYMHKKTQKNYGGEASFSLFY